MRKIIIGIVGILCGVAILSVAFNIRNGVNDIEIYQAKQKSAYDMEVEERTRKYTCSKEDPSWYGGDAYTGIQQAAAQTANNVMALDETVRETNDYLKSVNDAAKHTSRQMEDILNASMIEQQNQESTYCLINNIGFSIMLGIALVTIVKYLSYLVDGVGDIIERKKINSEHQGYQYQIPDEAKKENEFRMITNENVEENMA